MLYHTLPLNTPALIIEPDDSHAADYEVALRCAGYSPIVLHAGKQAIEQLPILQPALVVLDMQLPDITGMEILQLIDEDPRLNHTWVIVATSEPGFTVNLRQYANVTLIKPVTFTQMRDLALRFRRTV